LLKIHRNFFLYPRIGNVPTIPCQKKINVMQRRNRNMKRILNRLIDDMTTVMLTEFDAETRFRLRAARGAGQAALRLQLLDKAMGH